MERHITAAKIRDKNFFVLFLSQNISAFSVCRHGVCVDAAVPHMIAVPALFAGLCGDAGVSSAAVAVIFHPAAFFAGVFYIVRHYFTTSQRRYTRIMLCSLEQEAAGERVVSEEPFMTPLLARAPTASFAQRDTESLSVYLDMSVPISGMALPPLFLTYCAAR